MEIKRSSSYNEIYSTIGIYKTCVSKGCNNSANHEVLLKYLLKYVPLCSRCISEFQKLGFILEQNITIQEILK
jgi:hypothetical protein